MVAGIVDQAGIFVAPLGIEHQRRFFLQHLGEADDGVERRAQFVAHGGEEAAFRGIGALGLGAGIFERLLLLLAPGDVAQHRDHFAAAGFAGVGAGLFKRPAAHLDPDEFHRRMPIAIDAVAPHPELRRAALRKGGGVAERGQVGGPISDMDAFEQAMPLQISDARAEQRLAGRRHEQHAAVAAVPRDHVGHIACQQPIAVLFGVEQPEAGARQRLGAERKPRRIESCRNDAERGERRVRARARKR